MKHFALIALISSNLVSAAAGGTSTPPKGGLVPCIPEPHPAATYDRGVRAAVAQTIECKGSIALLYRTIGGKGIRAFEQENAPMVKESKHYADIANNTPLVQTRWKKYVQLSTGGAPLEECVTALELYEASLGIVMGEQEAWDFPGLTLSPTIQGNIRRNQYVLFNYDQTHKWLAAIALVAASYQAEWKVNPEAFDTYHDQKKE